VRNVEIVYNKATHRSKGYGFVDMSHLDDAKRAIDVLHDQFFMGRKLVVSGAKTRPDGDDADEQAMLAEQRADRAAEVAAQAAAAEVHAEVAAEEVHAEVAAEEVQAEVAVEPVVAEESCCHGGTCSAEAVGEEVRHDDSEAADARKEESAA
jgi:hypothetical protein